MIPYRESIEQLVETSAVFGDHFEKWSELLVAAGKVKDLVWCELFGFPFRCLERVVLV